MSSYITIVYHHMGKLKRDSNMSLVYEGGEETYFDYVNTEKFSLVQMSGLFKGLGYKDYDYVYWLDEDLGLNRSGLNMITGDLVIVMMCEWALRHENSVHMYFEHPIDKAIEFVNLEKVDDCATTQPPTNPPTTEDTPKKMRIKRRANRTPTPKKKVVNKKGKKVGQTSQNLLYKLTDPTTETHLTIQEQPKTVVEELDIHQSQPPQETQSQPQHEAQPNPQPQPQTEAQPQTQTETEAQSQANIAAKHNRRASYRRLASSGQ
ncbi:hypothetical protein PIB30_058633 [Stylosanthes scabra]|uniref:PB1-like domain-containing protein n=1 Tax=Stylosanthes scabra TaxID=79078 RepID=A0ABU6RKU2_9FABA|nr:hypothetical protein [Stylosanthes scabra]